MASGADHLHHVKTQMPYAVSVGIVSGICYLIAGFTGINPLLILLIGFIILVGIIRFLGKSVKEEDLRKEAVNS